MNDSGLPAAAGSLLITLGWCLQGVFMLAFKDAIDAVCWAVLLNLALLRSASKPHLLAKS